MLAYSLPTAIVTPYVPANVRVLAPLTVVLLPDVLLTVNDVEIGVVVNPVTRPYASVLITGILVALPTDVVLPGPTGVRLTLTAPVLPDNVTLPRPPVVKLETAPVLNKEILSVPPRATVPPPLKPVPVLIVTLEFVKAEFGTLAAVMLPPLRLVKYEPEPTTFDVPLALPTVVALMLVAVTVVNTPAAAATLPITVPLIRPPVICALAVLRLVGVLYVLVKL